MPDMAVLVSNVQPANGGVLVAFQAMTTGGAQAFESVVADFGVGAAVTNQAILDAAKVAQTAQNGVTFEPADKLMLFGGRV